MNESLIIDDGTKLGLTGEKLIAYVEQRRQREEKKRREDEEREERRFQREQDSKKMELEAKVKEDELKSKQLEIEKLKLQTSSTVVTPNSFQQVQSSTVKLNAYKDGDDLNVFLKTYDRVRTANNWNESIAITALMNAFVGSKIATFIDALPATTNLEDMKSEILSTYAANIYEHQNKFRFLKQNKEPFGQYVLAIKENFQKMCSLAKVQNNFKNLEDLIIKDQVLRSVDKNLAEYLKEQDIFRIPIEKVSELGENFQAIHGKPKFSPSTNALGKNDSPKCYACNTYGHIAKFCTASTTKPDRSSTPSTPTPATTDKPTSSARKCYACHQDGHISRYCPLKQDNILSVSLNSNMKSVSQSNLPVVEGKCNGKKVRILRDTGCTCVLVKKSLVKPNYFIGENAQLKLADDRIITAPKAKVNINSRYFKGTVEAACLEKLPFDVLIGNIAGANCACSKETENEVSSYVIDNSDEYEQVCAVTTRAQEEAERHYVKAKIGRGDVSIDMLKLY